MRRATVAVDPWWRSFSINADSGRLIALMAEGRNPMKKIIVRKTGSVKLTTSASAYWPPMCVAAN